MLQNLITSKTRLRLLVKFFVDVANEGYLRGLASEMNENTNANCKELNSLSQAEYTTRSKAQGKITYKTNQQHPMFGLLQKRVRKYIGLDTIVERVIKLSGDVQRVIVTGVHPWHRQWKSGSDRGMNKTQRIIYQGTGR